MVVTAFSLCVVLMMDQRLTVVDSNEETDSSDVDSKIDLLLYSTSGSEGYKPGLCELFSIK